MTGSRRSARNRLVGGILILSLLVIAAALAPLIAPYGSDALDLARRRAPPSSMHWFGTDELGRDLLTRILFGARVSLAVGLLSATVSVVLGVSAGAAAGYAGGWIDDVLMRLTDAMLSIPRLPLLMISTAVLGPSVPLLILLVGAAGWMETARVVRAQVQSIKVRDFVTAARGMGATSVGIVWDHVLPGVVGTAGVATTLAVGRGVLLESTLSFFGVGVQPPAASWGNMLYQAQTAMSTEPWMGVIPGVFIFLTVLCCNVVGDAMAEVRTGE